MVYVFLFGLRLIHIDRLLSFKTVFEQMCYGCIELIPNYVVFYTMYRNKETIYRNSILYIFILIMDFIFRAVLGL